jgi:hypothetical protein
MGAASAALATYCPDLEQWPETWCGDDSDLPPGQATVEFFKPFLLHLLDQGLATNTLHRHRDPRSPLAARRRTDPATLR